MRAPTPPDAHLEKLRKVVAGESAGYLFYGRHGPRAEAMCVMKTALDRRGDRRRPAEGRGVSVPFARSGLTPGGSCAFTACYGGAGRGCKSWSRRRVDGFHG